MNKLTGADFCHTCAIPVPGRSPARCDCGDTYRTVPVCPTCRWSFQACCYGCDRKSINSDGLWPSLPEMAYWAEADL